MGLPDLVVKTSPVSAQFFPASSLRIFCPSRWISSGGGAQRRRTPRASVPAPRCGLVAGYSASAVRGIAVGAPRHTKPPRRPPAHRRLERCDYRRRKMQVICARMSPAKLSAI